MSKWNRDPMPPELLEQLPPQLVADLAELDAAAEIEWCVTMPGEEPPDLDAPWDEEP